jgi:hypothetical protein
MLNPRPRRGRKAAAGSFTRTGRTTFGFVHDGSYIFSQYDFGGAGVCEKMMSRKLNPTMDQDQGDPIHWLDAS